MAEKKSKITIGPDGTIHVDEEEKPAASAGTANNPRGNVRTGNNSHTSRSHVQGSTQSKPLRTAVQIANERAEQSASQQREHSATRRKATSRHADNQAATVSDRGAEPKNTSTHPQQPSQKRKSVPDSVMLLLVGIGMLLLGIFVWPDIRLIVVGILCIVVAFVCNEWH